MRTSRRLLPLLALLALASPGLCDDDSTRAGSEDTFQWKQAIAESFLAVSLANGERVLTQPDTRHAIRGPFWKNYADSIENLHGFNDGDGFATSYAIHTMEGAFAGFVERQNDPLYRDVEYGKSQRYWVSCMRSLAFSSAYSTLWSATPFGEPGVGNVELHNEPGLVDLIGTQTLGLGWMVGEDALDRYMIKRFERRVQNPYVRALVRSMLNPMRGYANILALRVPWHRDSRPGVFEYVPEETDTPPDELTGPKFRARAWPENAAFEMLAEPVVERFVGSKGSTCIGGGGEAVLKLSRTDLAFAIDGCQLYGLPRHVSGDALNYVVGPRWRFRPEKRWTPFAEILVGGTKITQVTFDPQKKQELAAISKTHDPEYALYSTEADTNGFTMMARAGMSYRISDAFSWRVGSLDYQRSWLLDSPQGFDYNQGVRLTMGIAVTMGSWER